MEIARTSIKRILDKPFPPMDMADLEELMYWKCWLILQDGHQDILPYKAILDFERRTRMSIPTFKDLCADIKETVLNLEGKGWWSMQDILVLSYWKHFVDQEGPSYQNGAGEVLLEFLAKRGIQTHPINPDFLVLDKNMVKGVRVDAPGVSLDLEGPKESRSSRRGPPLRRRSTQQPEISSQIYDFDDEGDDGSSDETPPSQQAFQPRIRAGGAVAKEEEVVYFPSNPHPYEGIDTFRDFSMIIDRSFWDMDSNNSTALDIIAVYLKGQKILYIEAKTYCEQHLTLLMIPAIMISAACTVLSVSLGPVGWGTTFVSALTAVNSFILSIVSYMKLDAKAEAHKSSSYQFDKLQTLCEFHSGKTLFFSDKTAIKVVSDIQKKVEEIKDTNQFIIPESVRYRFPLLYNTNVFTEVKKIENMENMIKNKLNFLFIDLKKLSSNEGETPEIVTKRGALEAEKMALLRDYMRLREQYLNMDEKFSEEIKEQMARSQRFFCNPLNWFKT